MRRLPALALVLALSACRSEPAQAPAAATPASPASSASSAAPDPQGPAAATPGEADWGEPDLAKIQKLFRSRFAEVKRCYEAELQTNQAARGKLTLRFTIAETGALRDVGIARTTFRDRDVPACVVEVVRRWNTPFHPAEPVAVEYPFSFSPR